MIRLPPRKSGVNLRAQTKPVRDGGVLTRCEHRGPGRRQEPVLRYARTRRPAPPSYDGPVQDRMRWAASRRRAGSPGSPRSKVDGGGAGPRRTSPACPPLGGREIICANQTRACGHERNLLRIAWCEYRGPGGACGVGSMSPPMHEVSLISIREDAAYDDGRCAANNPARNDVSNRGDAPRAAERVSRTHLASIRQSADLLRRSPTRHTAWGRGVPPSYTCEGGASGRRRGGVLGTRAGLGGGSPPKVVGRGMYVLGAPRSNRGPVSSLCGVGYRTRPVLISAARTRTSPAELRTGECPASSPGGSCVQMAVNAMRRRASRRRARRVRCAKRRGRAEEARRGCGRRGPQIERTRASSNTDRRK